MQKSLLYYRKNTFGKGWGKRGNAWGKRGKQRGKGVG